MAIIIYVCKMCNFAYRKKNNAQGCERWCTKYRSCNIELTVKSIGLFEPITRIDKAR